MTNQRTLRRTTHSRVRLAILSLTLTLLSLPLGNKAMTNSTPVLAPTPTDSCIVQASVKVEKVVYQGKDNQGNDKVYVEWRDQSTSPGVYFGGGFDVPNQSNITPFGHEVTVKVKRRLGHEDTGSSKSAQVVNGNQVITDIIKIPRALLETDPVSFDVKVRTTAGVVLAQKHRLTGTGAPSFAAVTQTFSPHSTVANVLGTCFPTVQVSAFNFFPGAGPKPDRVTINFAAGLTSAAAPCFDPPKVLIIVRLTRPNGVVDTGQANVVASATATTIAIPGTPGTVASFEVLAGATTGSVVEKIGNLSGSF